MKNKKPLQMNFKNLDECTKIYQNCSKLVGYYKPGPARGIYPLCQIGLIIILFIKSQRMSGELIKYLKNWGFFVEPFQRKERVF